MISPLCVAPALLDWVELWVKFRQEQDIEATRTTCFFHKGFNIGVLDTDGREALSAGERLLGLSKSVRCVISLNVDAELSASPARRSLALPKVV